MRPLTSNDVQSGAAGPRTPSTRGASSVQATRKRTTDNTARLPPARRLIRHASFQETTHGLAQQDVVGRLAQLALPYLLRFGAFALGPEHLAQMGCDFRIGTLGQRAPQVVDALLELAHAVQCPAHAVQDERIVGRESVRLFD